MSVSGPELQLMLFINLIAAVSAIVWAVLANVMLIAPKASNRFALANVALLLGIGLLMFRTKEQHLLYWQGSDLFILLGFIFLKQGLMTLFKQPFKPETDVALLVLWLGPAILLQNGVEDSWFMGILFSTFASIWLGQATWVLYSAVRPNFALRYTLVMASPLAGLTIVFLVRLVISLLQRAPPIRAVDESIMFWAYLIFTLVINITMFSSALVRLVSKIRVLADRDQLTGLYNRYAINRFLSQQHQLWLRHQQPYSLLVCDLDHFKHLNDRLGHLAGDAALRSVADLLQQHLRAEDICGRFGGEEFIIILPQTTHPAAVATAQKLLQQIQLATVQFGNHSISLTISIGVQTVQAGFSIEDMLQHADNALYQAKENGRNRAQSGKHSGHSHGPDTR